MGPRSDDFLYTSHIPSKQVISSINTMSMLDLLQDVEHDALDESCLFIFGCTRKVSDNCSKSNPKYTNRVKLCITLIIKLLPQEFIVSKVEKRVQTEIFGA